MKKINWFTRLFMSWSKIFEIIKQSIETSFLDEKNKLQNDLNLKNQEILKNYEQHQYVLSENKKLIDEKDFRIKDFEQQLSSSKTNLTKAKSKSEEFLSNISLIKNNVISKDKEIANKNFEIEKIKNRSTNLTDLLNNEKTLNLGRQNKLDDLQKKFNITENENISLKSTLSFRDNEINRITLENKTFKKNDDVQNEKLEKNKIEIEKINSLINEIKNHNNSLKKEISEKLSPLNKIDKTFFGSVGNKGKGILGEMQLRQMLESCNFESSFWKENFMVGTKQVEFAIASDIEHKWIPVDSKVIDFEKNLDTNEIIINDKFVTAVKVQAKKVKEYLNKKNTTAYGLLVLQSDELYMSLFKEKPKLFDEVIREHKIYISSPSSFIQFAWSMSNILKVYEKVHKDEKIFNEITSLFLSINKFASSIQKTYDNFKTAFEKHTPALHKKQNIFIKKYLPESKMKILDVKGDIEQED